MSRNAIRQLKRLKHSTEAGASSAVQKERAKLIVMEAIGSRGNVREARFIDRFSWTLKQFVSMPVTVAVSLFVVVAGGSFTTVSAASNSLPGDTLYSVKLATERTQLRLASRDRRAILHTEFAERRLQEASEVVSDADRFTVAISEFKKQLDLAAEDVQKLQQQDPAQAVNIASAVDEKIGAISQTIDTQKTATPEANTSEATAAVKETSKAVVEVIVEEHEKEVDNPVTAESAKRTFQNKLVTVQTRQAFDLGRIVAIREWSDVTNAEPQDLARLEFEIKSVSDTIYDAMDTSAAGGYRTAFQMIESVSDDLSSIEARIVTLEMMIIEYRANESITEVNEEPAAEGAESIESTGEESSSFDDKKTEGGT